ncbi:MAG: TatD family hydrolase [Candidatus Altiarchaeota archaeon]|nr:TatD family hydrolase [Candidatus Altiarchaeota archaeon]
MLFDAHCHLSFPEFDKDRDEVVERALANDVSIINSSVSVQEIDKARSVKERYGNVHWTLGLSASETDNEKVDGTIDAIRKYRSEICGIGEVGLDYYWVKDEKGRARERENFLKFIRLSKETGLPLIVHSRDAEEDCIRMLEENGRKALMHCFSGTVEQAMRAASFGCLISVPANVTRVGSRQALAMALPLESLVLETDAPYLPPVHNTRNEPSNVACGAGKIAELKGISFEQVSQKTSENVRNFLSLHK